MRPDVSYRNLVDFVTVVAGLPLNNADYVPDALTRVIITARSFLGERPETNRTYEVRNDEIVIRIPRRSFIKGR